MNEFSSRMIDILTPVAQRCREDRQVQDRVSGLHIPFILSVVHDEASQLLVLEYCGMNANALRWSARRSQQ